jgi:hypothetical protein
VVGVERLQRRDRRPHVRRCFATSAGMVVATVATVFVSFVAPRPICTNATTAETASAPTTSTCQNFIAATLERESNTRYDSNGATRGRGRGSKAAALPTPLGSSSPEPRTLRPARLDGRSGHVSLTRLAAKGSRLTHVRHAD